MNTVVQHLGLAPFSQDGTFQGWLTPVSTSDIQPVWLLCPLSPECETAGCEHALRQVIRERDMSFVTLCEGTEVHRNVAILSGLCSSCKVCGVIKI
jgi:hypothetical protein